MVNTDEKYMKEAIKQAKKAYAIGEVPIGCVIVYEDKIIGRGYNHRQKYTGTCGASGNSKSQQKNGRLETGRLYDVCYIGAVSDVLRCNRSVAHG